MADDTIKSLNLLSSLRGAVSSLRQDFTLLTGATSSWNNVLGGALGKLQGQGGAGGPSSTQVAPYPVFSVTSGGTVFPPGEATGTNLVFRNPGTVSTERRTMAYAVGGGDDGDGSGSRTRGIPPRYLFAGAVGSVQAMPGTKEAVEMQLGTSRMLFYQQQAGVYASGIGTRGPDGQIQPFSNNPLASALDATKNSRDRQYKEATALLQELAAKGTITGKFDTVKAMEAARQYGIGAPNLTQVMVGNAQMSNLTPGIGVEGSTRAYGAMQQARNVNMLRGIGIRIRGEDGSLKPMPQIIDELWRKINREKMGSEPIGIQDVLISLQPGNALASMLDQYFGNDPLLRKQVEDGLIMKARSGGASFSGRDLKKLGEKYGATTAAVSSLSQRTAESMQTLQQVAPNMASAFTYANRILSYMSGFFNLIDRFAGILKFISFGKAGGETLGSGGNGGIAGLVGLAMNPFKFIGNLFKEEGGPVDKEQPYIVGEKGPELFVPKVSGTIIPNHELKNSPYREGGGQVNEYPPLPYIVGEHGPELYVPNRLMGGMSNNSPFRGDGGDVSATDWARMLAKRLGNKKPNEETIDAIRTWMRFEGGHWGNSADYNPLNTTLTKPGSKSMNSVGVKAYKTWDQGLDATVETLTGSKSKARGYADIIAAIKKGDREAILTAVNNSAWRTGKTGGAGAYKDMLGSSGDYDPNKRTNTNKSSGSDFSGKFSMGEFLKTQGESNKNLLASFVKDYIKPGAQQAAANTYNYGGVTVNLSGGGSPEANVAALKAALASSETLAKAANS